MNDFNIKKFLTENKMTRNSQSLNEVSVDDFDNPESPLARLNDGPDADVLNNITEKYGKDVVLYWLTSGNYSG